MTTHPSAVVPLLCQFALAGLFTESIAARTYTCDSVVFRAEVYADDPVSINVHGDDVKKYCDFQVQDDSAMGEVSCDAVDVLAEVHAPKELIIGVFESGFEKICQFSINGSLRSAFADSTDLPEDAASFEDGVQAGLAYLHGIQEYALAAAEHDAQRVRSASVQVLDRPADLIGTSVVNETGQALGELSGFAVNTRNNLLYAVLEVGGFFGIGASEIPLGLDQMRINQDRQLMAGGTTAKELKEKAKYLSSDYAYVDLPEIIKRDTITTVPASTSLSYLFASSNIVNGQNDFPNIYGQVNKYNAQIATCLYRFYSRLPIKGEEGEFSCVQNEEQDQLEMAIDLDNNRYRLVVFR